MAFESQSDCYQSIHLGLIAAYLELTEERAYLEIGALPTGVNIDRCVMNFQAKVQKDVSIG